MTWLSSWMTSVLRSAASDTLARASKKSPASTAILLPNTLFSARSPRRTSVHKKPKCSVQAAPCARAQFEPHIAWYDAQAQSGRPRTCVVDDVVVQQAGDVYHLGDLRYPLLPPPLLHVQMGG